MLEEVYLQKLSLCFNERMHWEAFYSAFAFKTEEKMGGIQSGHDFHGGGPYWFFVLCFFYIVGSEPLRWEVMPSFVYKYTISLVPTATYSAKEMSTKTSTMGLVRTLWSAGGRFPCWQVSFSALGWQRSLVCRLWVHFPGCVTGTKLLVQGPVVEIIHGATYLGSN